MHVRRRRSEQVLVGLGMANKLKRVVRIDPARHLDAMISGPIEPLLLLALDHLLAVGLGVLEGYVI